MNIIRCWRRYFSSWPCGLKKETGADIRFINLSGGIGIPYRPDQEPNDIRVIGEGVRRVYEEVMVPAGMGDVAIYTELGRFMMAPTAAW